MAVLLKKPLKSQKGLVVFTHKEWPLLLNSQKPYLEKLKRLFYVGVHTGWFLKDSGVKFEESDFLMTSESLYEKRERENLIPLCSRNFLPEDFKDLNFKERYFDICAINRPHKVKHTLDFLKALKNEFIKGAFYRVLIILPKSKNENKLEHELNLIDFYNKNFIDEEKEFVTIIRLSSEINFLGLPQKTIRWFLNNSKCFYGGSAIEGTCKAVHEALLCGCKIIYYKYTKSAIPDFLDMTNSVYFVNYQKINLSFKKAVELTKPTVNAQTIFELSSKFTQEKLLLHFSRFYKTMGLEMINNFENFKNLSRQLPAHDLSVPWFKKNGITADIRTKEQLIIFNNFYELYELNSIVNRFPINIKSYKAIKYLALIKNKYFA